MSGFPQCGESCVVWGEFTLSEEVVDSQIVSVLNQLEEGNHIPGKERFTEQEKEFVVIQARGVYTDKPEKLVENVLTIARIIKRAFEFGKLMMAEGQAVANNFNFCRMVKKFESKDGSDIKPFLEELDTAFMLDGVTDRNTKVNVLKFMTNEPVREFLGGITAAVDYENVEVQLRDRFSRKLAIQACAGAVRLMEINCKHDEFAMSCKEFRDLKKKLGVTGTRDLKEALYNYLSTNIESCQNFEDMIVAGETFLKLLSKRRGRKSPEKVEEVDKKPESQRFQGSCNWCGKKYHKENECWSKRNGKLKVTEKLEIGSTDVKINVMDKKNNTSLVIEEFMFGKVLKKGLVDSGAAVNFVKLSSYFDIQAGDPEVKLLPYKKRCLFGVKEVIPVGTCMLGILWRDKQLRLPFIVLLDKDVSQKYDSIIGVKLCLSLKLMCYGYLRRSQLRILLQKMVIMVRLNNIVIEDACEVPEKGNVLKESQNVLTLDVNEDLKESTVGRAQMPELDHELSSDGVQSGEKTCRLVRDKKNLDKPDALKRVMEKPLICYEDPGKKFLRTNTSDVAYDAGGCQEREIGEGKVENGPLLELSMKRRNFKKGRNTAVLDSRLACKLVSGNLCESTGINEISEGKGTEEAQKI
uniref:Peptidase A2 domain-containing protein n=1 Tax=Strongyloides papillosus TaxID=174720 RepID=A0A0N5BAP6_STREA